MIKAAEVKISRPGSRESVKRYVQNHPWYPSYNHAKGRCKTDGAYGRRGIKFLMTIEDFEYLWNRDNANGMDRPSIDRIDTDGNYILDNCRFIELRENMKRTRGWIKIILDNWDESITLKESSIKFNKTYDAIQRMAYVYKLNYKRDKCASKFRSN